MNDLLLIRALISAGFDQGDARLLHRYLLSAPTERRLAFADAMLDAAAQKQAYEIEIADDVLTQPLVVTPFQVPAVCYNLLYDRDHTVRFELAKKLGDLEISERVPLLAYLAQDPDATVQAMAVQQLSTCSPFVRSMVMAPHVVANWPAPLLGGDYLKGWEEPDLLSELRDTTVRRFTELGFRPDRPAGGTLSFCLRVERTTEGAHPVDVRVQRGRHYAVVLVHATSEQFSLNPTIQTIKVPRNGDSEVAHLAVQAVAAVEGEVALLIYDEVRLIGSLQVRLRATETETGLVLERIGLETFRDPAPAAYSQPVGITLQISLTQDGNRRVQYDLLVSEERDGAQWPALVRVGQSPDAFDASHVQSALTVIKAEVEEIERNLGAPQLLGADTAEEALQGLRMNIDGAGREIGEDILPAEVRALLVGRGLGSVINWVIRDRALDGVPWELASDPITGRSLSEDFLLVRVPVRDEVKRDVMPAHDGTTPEVQKAPGGKRLLYILGNGVVTGAESATADVFTPLREVVRSATGKYEVIDNFSGNGRSSMSIVKFQQLAGRAQIIHVLCHGILGGEGDYYLQLEDVALGRLRPHHIRALRLAPNTLVFVNACSSASATFSTTGLTTFGWSFFKAGAAVYIGTLAPVTTRLALRFAQAFFDAYLGEHKLSVPHAMFEAKRALAADADPTWLLYAVYGDLHITERNTA